MKPKKFYTVLSFLLAGAFRLSSQVAVLAVDHVMVNAAPLQMEIHAVLLDSRGFLWIGSQNGLARYDGYRVIPCRLDEAERPAAADPAVRSLCEDQNGLLWLATAQGLVRYDPASGTSARFHHDPLRSDTISGDNLTCLYISAAIPGRLWIASAGGDLDELDLASGHVARHAPTPATVGAPRPGRIHVISGDPAGFLWIGAASGLYRFLPLEGRLQFCPPPTAVSGLQKPFGIKAILCDRRFPDTLWIGSDSAGLLRYLPAAGLWQRHEEAGTFGDLPADASINAVAPFPGEPQNLILGADDGLYRFDPRSGSIDRISLVFNNIDVQSSQCARAIYPDRLGNYWIGSCRNGLDKWSPVQKKFSRFRPFTNVLPSSLANWVTSILELGGGEILLTTYGGGAFTFNRRTNVFRPRLLDPANPGRKLNTFITDSAVGRDGSLWFSTAEGLARCSATGRLLRLYGYTTGESPANEILVYGFFQDSRGRKWISSDRGLIRLDPENGELRQYRHERQDPRSLSNNRVNSFMEETGGPMWLGTDDGLNLYQPQGDGFTIFKNDPADPDSLSSSQIFAIEQDSLGRIWICTGKGLNLLRREGGRILFRRYLAPGSDPLQNLFGSLVEESSRYFWLGCKAGLARFDTRWGTFTFYDRRDGVVADGLSEIFFFFRSREGEIFFGGRPGFTFFRPDQLALNPHPPPVVMTGFQVGAGHDDTEVNDPLPSQLPRQPIVITAAGGLNSLRVEFAALDFFRPEKNQYAYRLEGRDRDWVYQGTDRVVRLAGLRPGRYTLRVKAANNDGIWNENGLAVNIVVRRPFWRTWGLGLLLGLLLMILAAFITWWRRRSRLLRRVAMPDNLDLILEKFAISKREAEIVRLLLAGKSNKEIEDALFIAMSTVKIHVHNIFQKIKVGSRLQLLLRIQQEAKKLK
jgi:ligand-binding sensor domain-containing protein/DNA-binding CsgD family transcriptional regulator